LSNSSAFVFSEDDGIFMRRALSLARLGRYTASPNPRVGCVVVQPPAPGQSAPRIIGEGYHRRKGTPHAERNALAACDEDPRGATLYVTLEPCCHYGATPPCTDAILEAGISRVVAAILDPFPEVQGKGVEILRNRGVRVDVGLLEEEAGFENRFFFHYQIHKRPWVILKAAMTLDGKLATHTGHSQWITGEEARAHVHEIRAEVDAILAGIGTVKADNPLLTSRSEKTPEGFKQPTRVILDPQLQIPRTSKLIRTIDRAPLWIFCHHSAPEYAIQELTFLRAAVTPVNGSRSALDLNEILQTLASSGVQSLMIEGGPRVHTAFLESRLVNELLIYIAPKIIGGENAPTFFMGTGEELMDRAERLERIERMPLGADTLIRGVLRR
jgi:diaminohydroxyphosphoribosylaminopyrimidine deaminase / 5-amino-6-(5-phosphoribosylamino)uracil reductase